MATRTSPAHPPLTVRHAVLAAGVLAVGLTSLTSLTWAQLGHYALVVATVGAAVTLAAYVMPHARRVVAWLTPAR